MQAPRLLVDMGDPKAFPGRIGVGKATFKKGLRLGQPVELQRKFGTLMSHCGSVSDPATRHD